MLRLENLSTFYGNFEAIKGISMSVEQGELVAVIGANGAGKTTLMRTICGLHRPKKGTIKFSQKDITSLGPVDRVKEGIVYCPEGRKLFPEMKVAENLEMGAYTCIGDLEENLDKVLSLFPPPHIDVYLLLKGQDGFIIQIPGAKCKIMVRAVSQN